MCVPWTEERTRKYRATIERRKATGWQKAKAGAGPRRSGQNRRRKGIRWTEEQRQKFKATMAKKYAAGWRPNPAPTVSTKRRPTQAQRIVINGRTHRRQGDVQEGIDLGQKAQTAGSWWMVNQSPEQLPEWFEAARGQVERMCGSPEFKQLGHRKALDQFGPSAFRSAVES